MTQRARSPQREDRVHREKDNAQEFRTPFQRDRDRVLHSSAFRRLAGVTQVIAANEEGHLLHNRLTHSIKVAQIARRIAEHLNAIQEGEAEELGLDADVVEAAALAHDLGHPPFGHIAEVELDEIAKARGLSDAFEGNAQTFRIVTKLSRRVPADPGLNLTRATLNAILKYPWLRSTDGSKKERKWGAFDTEREDFEFARKLCPDGDVRKSAEAEIMDWSDDIAYSVHDVEDFYRVGLIPLDRLATNKSEVSNFFEAAFERRKAEGLEHHAKHSRDQLRVAFERVRSSGLFPRKPYSHDGPSRGELRVLTGKLIARFVNAIRLQVPRTPKQDRVTIVPGPEREVTMLKELTWHYVINNPSLATQQHGQRSAIRLLYDVFEKAAFVGDLPLFPPMARAMIAKVDKQPRLPRGHRQRIKQRLVVDLIAGLTEREALRTYHRLQGIAPGSALEKLYSI